MGSHVLFLHYGSLHLGLKYSSSLLQEWAEAEIYRKFGSKYDVSS